MDRFASISLSMMVFVFPMAYGQDLINLYEPASLASHRPVIVAHRGGVVEPGVPENSIRALQLASERGYAMVEVDVRTTTDEVPVVFHDDELEQDVGVTGRIEELSSAQATALRYKGSDEHIVTLDDYLRLASELKIGIMLDIKSEGGEKYYTEIARQIRHYGLEKATLTISRSPNAVNYLDGLAMQRMTREQFDQIKAGEQPDIKGLLWFDWPRYITNEEVARIQALGALVIPSINVFHYPETEHLQRAAEDISRMRDAGVDAYQIDSVYDQLGL